MCNVFQFASKTMWNNGTGRVEEKVQVQGQGDLGGTLEKKNNYQNFNEYFWCKYTLIK